MPDEAPCPLAGVGVSVCVEVQTWRQTSRSIPSSSSALEVSGERTKKAAVTKALEEFIARRNQKRLVELMGALEWDETFDCKSEPPNNLTI